MEPGNGIGVAPRHSSFAGGGSTQTGPKQPSPRGPNGPPSAAHWSARSTLQPPQVQQSPSGAGAQGAAKHATPGKNALSVDNAQSAAVARKQVPSGWQHAPITGGTHAPQTEPAP